jgi:hypothetical protein
MDQHTVPDTIVPDKDDHPVPEIREAHDAGDHPALRADPAHEDAKLDVALDESFPTSDPPANTAPGGHEAAPSSGYDEVAEQALIAKRDGGSGEQSGWLTRGLGAILVFAGLRLIGGRDRAA